jgi:hypothetical protein
MSPKHLLGSGFFLLTAVTLLLTSPGDTRADVVQLTPDHPERYTVVKGDTLWDISTRFLKSPWMWPKIWKINQDIKNPHLIYPGDVIVLTMVNGQPQLSVLRKEKMTPELPSLPSVSGAPAAAAAPSDGRTIKLEPQVHSEPLESAIPTIQPNTIAPFLSRPLAVGKNELEDAGYIAAGFDDRIALGNGNVFYARGLKDDGPEYYQVFRLGKPIHEPDTGELLAYEAIYLGDAQLLEPGDPSKLVITSVKQEILPTDRLLAAPKKASLPYYYPHPPKTQVQGRVVSALNSLDEIGPFSIIGISLGTREGMDNGTVLRVMRHVGTAVDPVTHERFTLPDEESGLAMVFRTYEKMSYALIMTETHPVHMLDSVITP